MQYNKVIRMDYLLIEPEFPIPTKSKNHQDFLPIGLLKLTAMLKNQGHQVQIVRGNRIKTDIQNNPKEIWITSLFTYWIEYVRESVTHYRSLFPKSIIVVGGIAASLFGEKKTIEFTNCDKVVTGVVEEAEDIDPKILQETYDEYIPDVDYQILHAQRGCIRRCEFCGTWKIEPKLVYESSIKNKIFKRKLVFYDNNFLANENIDAILDELIELKKNRKILWCESQSGFDGRLLIKRPKLALKIKQAGFRNVRIAWDWGFKDAVKIKKQIETLKTAGYQSKELFVFVLYNWNITFDEMEQKRAECFKWGVQLSDCRYRPLYQEYDYYKGSKVSQTKQDYHIHEEGGWTDHLVKQFRKNVRRHNICIRHGLDYHSPYLERKRDKENIRKQLKEAENNTIRKAILTHKNIDFWDPSIAMTKEDIGKILGIKEQKKMDDFI